MSKTRGNRISEFFGDIAKVWQLISLSTSQKMLLLFHVIAASIVSLSDYGLIAVVIQYALRKLNPVEQTTTSIVNLNIPIVENLAFINTFNVILLIIIRLLLGFLSARYYYDFLAKIALSESGYIFQNIMYLPEDAVAGVPQATRKNLNIHGSNTLVVGYIGSLGLIVADVSAIILLIVLICALNASLGLGIIFFIASNLIIYILLVSKSVERNAHLNQKLINNLDDIYFNIMSIRRELLVTNRMRNFKFQYLKMQKDFSESTSRGFYLAQLPKLIIDGLFFVFLFSLIFLGDFVKSRPDITSIAIFAVLATIRLIPGLIKIQSLFALFMRARGQILALLPDLQLFNFFANKDTIRQKTVLDMSIVTKSQAISLENVSFQFISKRMTSINNIFLKVEVNEFVLLTGESGVGKSTLVNLILGLIEPRAGEVRIFGHDSRTVIENIPGLIGYVPQSPQFLKNSSWIRNIAIGVPEESVNRELVKELLGKFLGFGKETLTESFLDSSIQNLSGGELKRLGIARAMYTEPKLVIMDEPLGELDEDNRNIVKYLLQDLKQTTSIFCVSHDLTIESLADRILILNKYGLNEK